MIQNWINPEHRLTSTKDNFSGSSGGAQSEQHFWGLSPLTVPSAILTNPALSATGAAFRSHNRPVLTHQGHPDGQGCSVDAEVLQDVVAHKAQH